MRHYELVTLLNILLLSFFLLSLLIPNSSMAALQHKGNVEKIHKSRAEYAKGQLKDTHEGEIVVIRKGLHEVNSGTNPIGNSIPQEKRNMRTKKLQRFP